MTGPPQVAVRVWGDYACFTRPEMKVERVSYPVMTPSAARGVLEAIFWRREFFWRVRQIEVLKPIRRISFLRNEVKSKVSPQTARKEGNHYYADDDRTQRHTLALRDVAYVICADIALTAKGAGQHPQKYVAQFERRVVRGKCYHRPCLGCREFPAYFGVPDPNESPIALSEDLGRMLLDLRYGTKGSRIEPVFFSARLQKGVLHVPQHFYDIWEAADAAQEAG